MAGQVAAGADVLFAHTFLTHRRALAKVGEARRARGYTLAAVVLAREAADQGRDRRQQGAPWASDPVLVAGVLPVLGEDAEGGRLGASGARDLHDHAGSLADAGVDVILVDGPRAMTETAAAVGAARSMGLETWAVTGASAGLAREEWGSPDAMLLSVGVQAEVPARATDAITPVERELHEATGVMLAAGPDRWLRQNADEWLAAGAMLLGIGEGATSHRLGIVRDAIDDRARRQAAERDTQAADWLAWVALGSGLAPPGAAAWLSARPPRSFATGWDWTVATPDDLRRMPAERYRLVVSESFEPTLEQLALRLDDGGVLIAMTDPTLPVHEPLQTIDSRDSGTHRWIIARRR